MQKACFSSLPVRSFGPKRGSLQQPINLHNILNRDQKCLFIIHFGCNAMQLDPSMDILGTQAVPRLPCFGHYPQILKPKPTTCDTVPDCHY